MGKRKVEKDRSTAFIIRFITCPSSLSLGLVRSNDKEKQDTREYQTYFYLYCFTQRNHGDCHSFPLDGIPVTERFFQALAREEGLASSYSASAEVKQNQHLPFSHKISSSSTQGRTTHQPWLQDMSLRRQVQRKPLIPFTSFKWKDADAEEGRNILPGVSPFEILLQWQYLD